jgi:hypothetical protein
LGCVKNYLAGGGKANYYKDMVFEIISVITYTSVSLAMVALLTFPVLLSLFIGLSLFKKHNYWPLLWIPLVAISWAFIAFLVGHYVFGVNVSA